MTMTQPHDQPSPPVDSSAGRRVDPTTLCLLGLRIVVLVTVIVGVPRFPSSAASRYVAIAETPGIPYRDFPVEYAPVEVAILEGIGAGGPDLARALLGVVAFTGDMIAFGALRRGWGAATARRYLWLGAPLLLFIYRRPDLLSVGLVVLGLVLANRRRERWGGLAVAAAILTRVWPIVLVPILAIRRRTSSLRACALSLVLVLAGWIALAGIGAPGQVVSFRGATGWEIESSVGVVVWFFTGERRFEAGAFRAGTIAAPVRVLLVVLLVLTLAAIWGRARRWPGDPAGPPALAAVAALLALSTVLSPPYVAWLLPWAAIAGTTDRRWTVPGFLPVALTGLVVAVWYLDIWRGHPGLSQVILFARNLALLAPVAMWLWPAGRGPIRWGAADA